MYRIYIALEVLRKTVAEIALKGKKKEGEKKLCVIFQRESAIQRYRNHRINFTVLVLYSRASSPIA